MSDIIIHQGEQILIPFEIKLNGDAVTPADVDGIKIKVINRTCKYPDGDLIWNDEDDTWDYPLTQEQSFDLSARPSEAQISIKIGSSIIPSDVFSVDVRNSIIKELW